MANLSLYSDLYEILYDYNKGSVSAGKLFTYDYFEKINDPPINGLDDLTMSDLAEFDDIEYEEYTPEMKNYSFEFTTMLQKIIHFLNNHHKFDIRSVFSKYHEIMIENGVKPNHVEFCYKISLLGLVKIQNQAKIMENSLMCTETLP